MRDNNHTLRFLILRAVITVVAVLALLLGLRLSGVLQAEPDIPMEAVGEGMAEIT